MRLASVLVSAILLLCISVHAYDSEPGDIAEPSIEAPNMDTPNAPVSSPSMDTPEIKPTPLVKPNNNLNPVPNKTNNNTNQNHATQIQQRVKPIDVSGKWSIRLDDGSDRSLDLTLWQSAGATGIMGFGTLTEGSTKNSVTASGSVIEQELRLTAKLATPEYANLNYDECDLDLHNVSDTLSGTYVLRSAGKFLGKGNATAEIAPAS